MSSANADVQTAAHQAAAAAAASSSSELMEQILYEVKRVVVGQDRFLERVMVAMLAEGHLLVEGVPGLAKTLTVKTLADTVQGRFKRIQFTPDLVPADLVGTRIYNQKTGDFSTSLGPVFANLLLADTSFTAYWMSDGSTYTRRACACNSASCSVVAMGLACTGGPITRSTMTNSSSSVG